MKIKMHLFVLGFVLISGFSSTNFIDAADLDPEPPQKTDEKEAIFKEPGKSKVSRTFVVETDENTAAESLDRISGQIDLGFLSPKQVFQSPNHYRAGPFSREKTESQRSNVSDS